jgi:peptidoglycan-associated lipoprotein
MNKLALIPVVMLVFAISACSGTGKRGADEGMGQTPAGTEGIGSRAPSTATPVDRAQLEREEIAALGEGIIYFDFDNADIRAQDAATVNRFADYLIKNPNKRVRLEGHTDERGTREYNVGLGERRARSVSSAMMARGVSSRQLSVVSYGEERPAQLGQTESAWAKNRRVEIVFQ